MTWYNEIDPFAARWLRELQAGSLIEKGFVDERRIETIETLEEPRAHFFAGIGGWDYALRLAGWPVDRPVWTGSCPCQPFSVAGKGAGEADPRHLWPAWFRLIRVHRPDTIFGEQVAGAIGHGWLDGVFADLEAEGYTCGAVVLGAHSVGAPHIRQRLYWVAESERRTSERYRCQVAGTSEGMQGEARKQRIRPDTKHGIDSGGLGDSDDGRRARIGWCWEEGTPEPGGAGGMEHSTSDRREQRGAESGERGTVSGCEPGRVANTDGREPCDGGLQRGRGHLQRSEDAITGHWSDSIWHPCSDGRSRRIPTQPALQPLAPGLQGRVGILRGAGNSIVPQVAAAFVRAYMEEAL